MPDINEVTKNAPLQDKPPRTFFFNQKVNRPYLLFGLIITRFTQSFHFQSQTVILKLRHVRRRTPFILLMSINNATLITDSLLSTLTRESLHTVAFNVYNIVEKKQQCEIKTI